MMDVIIRGLLDSEDEQVNSLLNLAFQSSTNRLNDIRFYRVLQPDGWFAAIEEGRVIGTVGAISYGAFAHVGFMTVHPDKQGHGLGRMLMEYVLDWLEGQNVPIVTLDASSKGRPLYQKLGFVENGETAIYERSDATSGRILPSSIQIITLADLDELSQIDRAVFGADRKKVFKALLEMYPSRGFLQRDAEGKITGYLYAHLNRIGPWVMLDPGHAEELLQAALTVEYENPIAVCVPTENQQAIDLLQEFGFKRIRAGSHMFKGKSEISGERSKVFAQTSLGAG